MRKLAFFAPLAATLAVAAASQAQPADITVALGPDLQDKSKDLGEREVARQVDRLVQAVDRALADQPRYQGARINLVLTDLEPNRPTFQQVSERPGLSPFHSISIGGAAIEGEIVTADGERLPVRYARYSNSLQDVVGYATWQDADRTFTRFASNLAAGRLEAGERSRAGQRSGWRRF